jgi:hypothetical protein
LGSRSVIITFLGHLKAASFSRQWPMSSFHDGRAFFGTITAATISSTWDRAGRSPPLPHARIRVEHFLDFAGRHVFAAGLDHVLFAVPT